MSILRASRASFQLRNDKEAPENRPKRPENPSSIPPASLNVHGESLEHPGRHFKVETTKNPLKKRPNGPRIPGASLKPLWSIPGASLPSFQGRNEKESPEHWAKTVRESLKASLKYPWSIPGASLEHPRSIVKGQGDDKGQRGGGRERLGAGGEISKHSPGCCLEGVFIAARYIPFRVSPLPLPLSVCVCVCVCVLWDPSGSFRILQRPRLSQQ